jgi:hypothetical protein
MPIYEPRECKNPRCANTFIPSRGNQVYCCYKCGKHAYNYSRPKSYKKTQERIEEAAKKRKKEAWDEVNAFIKQYKAETGKYLTYGKAVLLMEKRGAKNESET